MRRSLGEGGALGGGVDDVGEGGGVSEEVQTGGAPPAMGGAASM
ncbi:hypothetical protein Mlaev_01354 [Microbacterium laevaniformans]|uniref:Uncharacterized protein n=1 Tax=Microbacterium laevaniformans TaxID=36807 RepID=A0A150HFJ7_9MICO|nr:hypothetical protein Mlaev_01354 [Microbacterium laevaniformans]